MKRLIVAILLLIVMVRGVSSYEPLSEEEAKEWILARIVVNDEETVLVHEELINFIINFDYIEHSKPFVPFPNYVLILAKNNAYLIPSKAEDMLLGHLVYSIAYPSVTFEDVIPKCDWITPFAIGTVIGIATTLTFMIWAITAR